MMSDIDKYRKKEGVILDNTIRSCDYLRGVREYDGAKK